MDLYEFVAESNRIEGIIRAPLIQEVQAHKQFLKAPISVEAVIEFVASVQPDAILRERVGLNVQVGRYLPPAGGPWIRPAFVEILKTERAPYNAHQAYEALHPFTDGNGRSGRVLWLHLMGGIANAPLGFLHHWYYQSLQNFCQVPQM